MQRAIFTIAFLSVCCLGVAVQAQESWWSRLNPFRQARPATARDATPRDATTRDTQRMNSLRSRMTDRGIDDAAIDQRIDRITNNLANRPTMPPQAGGRRPTSSEIRARLEQRGISADAIDQRMSRLGRPSTAGRGRRGFVTGTGAPASADRLREKWLAQGVSQEEVDARLSRILRPTATGDGFVADRAPPLPPEDGFVADFPAPVPGEDFVVDHAPPASDSTSTERSPRASTRLQKFRRAVAERRRGTTNR